DDGAILRELGITDAPALVWSDTRFAATDQGPHAKWFRGWHERGVTYYFSKLPNSRRPDRSYIGAFEVEMPAGWPLLLLVDGPALQKITKHFLAAISASRVKEFGPAVFRHSTRANAYPSEIYGHPLAQLLLEKGKLENAGGQ